LTIQSEVYNSVVDRGYREGYSAEQFIARQVAKLQEELWELAQRIDLPIQVYRTIELAGKTSKEWFDKGKFSLDDTSCATIELAGKTSKEWFDKGKFSLDDTSCAVWGLQQELADIQVVVFCLAEELSKMQSAQGGVKRVDITKLALDKARKDVQRGIR
jgi:hypothetical protein